MRLLIGVAIVALTAFAAGAAADTVAFSNDIPTYAGPLAYEYRYTLTVVSTSSPYFAVSLDPKVRAGDISIQENGAAPYLAGAYSTDLSTRTGGEITGPGILWDTTNGDGLPNATPGSYIFSFASKGGPTTGSWDSKNPLASGGTTTTAAPEVGSLVLFASGFGPLALWGVRRRPPPG